MLVSLLYFADRGRNLPPSPQPPKVAKTSGAPTSGLRGPTRRPGPRPAHSAAPPPTIRQAVSPANVLPAPRPHTGAVPAKPARARLSVVIDDFGPNLAIARQFASIPFPVTLSVLPFLAHSGQIAAMARQRGREVILHLPMEPVDSRINPGPGALMVSMSSDQIRLSVVAALTTSPYFDGVNNHEGSRLTQDAKAMRTVLAELKDRKLFFLDSMTINTSVGWKEARLMGVPTFKRDIFLDDNLSAAAIRLQIEKAVKIAKARGAALAIGHPHELTLRALLSSAAYFRQEGVEMVFARDLVGR
ncbi:MAG: divergent polysaccharide deacetylase family protein [Syntrophobacteraceae bacterium]|nr:divergent polysaccharide deacetylase family protein [Syntrophobacteraceae bacterium]